MQKSRTLQRWVAACGTRGRGLMEQKVHTLKSGGRLHYLDTGSGDVLLFVHGIWVNHHLWKGVMDALPGGFRCIAPDWPLGSQPEAFPRGADLSPHGVADMVCEFMEALDLQDVTLVGNDSGGGVCQLLITSENPAAARVGRLVLTNSDVFDQFPPKAFQPIRHFARLAPWLASPLLGRLMSYNDYEMFFGEAFYGATCSNPVPGDLRERIVGPCVRNAVVRRASLDFLVGCKPEIMLAATRKFADFRAPVLLVWGNEDTLFPLQLAQNLIHEFPDARLVEVPEASLFLPLDAPARVATEIAAFVGGDD